MDAKQVDSRVRRLLSGIRQAFRGKISRTDSARGVQRAQVEGLDGETVQALEHAEQFGFTGHPPTGSDCIVLPLGGKTSHGIIVNTSNGAYRITGLGEGEAAVYNADGAKIVLKRGRIIDVDCHIYNIRAPGGVNIDAPDVYCTQQITAAGQINGNGGLAVQGGQGTSFSGDVVQTGGSYTTDGDVVASGKSLVSHTHTGDSGGATSPPV